MSDEAQLNSSLNLMRRLPPSAAENSLAGLIEIAPQLTDELLTHVDQPLKVHKDPKAGKYFVQCDYNRDGDSYRYFEGGYSSAYFFETDEKDTDAFGACFLIHKDVETAKSLKKGWWDSIHVFEVTPDKDNFFIYKLTTTVMISMVLTDDKVGNVDLSGLRTQQDSKRLENSVESPHIANMGKMLEDIELRIRNAIEGIYIQKTREVINGMRSATGKRDADWGNIARDLNAAVYHHAAKKKE